MKHFSSVGLLVTLMPLSASHAQPKTPVAQPKTPVAQPKTPVVKSKTPTKVEAQPVFKLDALPIAALPQVPVEFEFVGTQKDLLGLVQSVARGVTTAPAKPASPNTSGAARLFSDADVLNIVRDIRFLRAQSFNFLKMEQQQDAAREKAGQPRFESDAARPKRVDVQEFYGKVFRAQKGQRQFFSSSGDADGDSGRETTVSIWRFDAPRSWTLVTQGPSRAIVVRADGLPRVEVLGRLFRLALNSN